MKKIAVLLICIITIVAILIGFEMFGKTDTQVTVEEVKQPMPAPEFYKGIYLKLTIGT